MSTVPSRTRSIRKPAERSNLIRTEKLPAAAPSENNASPSRLPTIKPRSKTDSAALTSSARPLSTSLIGTNNTSSMRPPPPRASTSKPLTSSGLTRSTSIKNAATASTTSEPVKDRSRPPITTTNRHSRNLSSTTTSSTITRPSHIRTKSSTSLLSNPATILRPPSQSSQRTQPPEASVRARPQSLYGESQVRKPTFSTLQQHFSPAKNLGPKPHPASFLAAPTPSKLPSNIAISAETAKLQNELLQLHILHRDAEAVTRQWKASAKKKLGAKFQAVVKRHDGLVHAEVEEAGKANAVALKEWQAAGLGTPGWGLEERVQVFDEVLNAAWEMGMSGGKYARVVRNFEKWVVRCEQVLKDREEDKMLDEEEEIVFIEEMPTAWKAECLVLGRKLEGWRDALVDLGGLKQDSTVKSAVEGVRSLVNGMLAELETMAQIESDAVALEQEWIKSVNGSLEDVDTPAAGAVWRFM